MNASPSIFITGTQRSGTTLLCRILSTHQDIILFNEIFSYGEIENVLLAEDASEKFLHSLKQKNVIIDKKVWGLKDPYLTCHLDKLIERFPDAKIIITLRDGRAVGNSYLKTKWGTANIYYGAKRWKEEVILQTNFMRKFPGNTHLLHYEDLITHPENELRKICTFLGVPYDKAMLNYHENPLGFRENKSNVNTKRPLDPSIINKWQAQLSPFQINVFETVAGDTLQDNGYELIGEHINIPPVLKLWFKVQQKVVGEIQLQYQWRIKGFLRKHFEKS